MNTITSKIDFDRRSSVLCGRMVSLDVDTRKIAAAEAREMLRALPSFLKNSPHCKDEIQSVSVLIGRVESE